MHYKNQNQSLGLKLTALNCCPAAKLTGSSIPNCHSSTICHLQLLVQSRNLLAPDSPPAVEKDSLPEPATDVIIRVRESC